MKQLPIIPLTVNGYTVRFKLFEKGHAIHAVEWEPDLQLLSEPVKEEYWTSRREHYDAMSRQSGCQIRGRYRIKGTPYFLRKKTILAAIEQQVVNLIWRNVIRDSIMLANEECAIPQWREAMMHHFETLHAFKWYICRGALDQRVKYQMDNGQSADPLLLAWLECHEWSFQYFLADLCERILNNEYGHDLRGIRANGEGFADALAWWVAQEKPLTWKGVPFDVEAQRLYHLVLEDDREREVQKPLTL